MNAPLQQSPDAVSEAVARAVWDWRAGSRQAAPRDRPRLRQAVQGIVALGAGTLFGLLHVPRASLIALCLGVIGLLLAAIAPLSWLRGIRKGIDAFADLVGTVVSVLVLSLVYFGFILPVGIVLRRSRDARYQSRLDRTAASYWKPVQSSGSAERQY